MNLTFVQSALKDLFWGRIGVMLAQADKMAERAIKTLEKKGVSLGEYNNGYIMYIPKGSLGIKAWGYVDAIAKAMRKDNTFFMYTIVDKGVHEFSVESRTRRVSGVDKERLEQKKKLHAKRPYKHAAVK